MMYHLVVEGSARASCRQAGLRSNCHQATSSYSRMGIRTN